MTAEAFAPAKLNLALHVIGQRDDGYHLLDSVVAFAGRGDRIHAEPSDRWSLEVIGPMAAGVPDGEENLCLRAARATDGPPAALTLDKRLPLASGIGGGSSDAAATLRALAELDGRRLSSDPVSLGADVPVCLYGRAARMSGIGETIAPVDLPAVHACLVNPGVPVPTGAVFAALTERRNAPLPDMPRWSDAQDLARWLGRQRNDLEGPARLVAPAIGAVLAMIGTTDGCLLSRMSGSGATCFGLYGTSVEAEQAACAIAHERPGWWVQAAPLS